MQVRAIANTARDKACGIALGTIEAIAFEVQCERFKATFAIPLASPGELPPAFRAW